MKILSFFTLLFDLLKQFILQFKLQVYYRVKMIAIALLRFAVDMLNSLVDNLSYLMPSRVFYKVSWHYVVTERNLAQVLKKVPYHKIRKLLLPGDYVWCIKGTAITPSYVFYRSRVCSEHHPDGAVGFGRKCIWGHWLDNETIMLDDNSYMTIDGYQFCTGDVPFWWEDRMEQDDYDPYEFSSQKKTIDPS